MDRQKTITTPTSPPSVDEAVRQWFELSLRLIEWRKRHQATLEPALSINTKKSEGSCDE